MSRLCHASHLIQGWDILSLGLQGLDGYKAKYAVDEVHYTDDMGRVLSELKPVSVHLLCGTNTDRWNMLAQLAVASVCYSTASSSSDIAVTQHYLVSCSSIATQPADFEGLEGFNLDKSDVLFNVLTDCRVVRPT